MVEEKIDQEISMFIEEASQAARMVVIRNFELEDPRFIELDIARDATTALLRRAIKYLSVKVPMAGVFTENAFEVLEKDILDENKEKFGE